MIFLLPEGLFLYFCSVGVLVMNSLSHCLPGKVFIYISFGKILLLY